MQGTGSRLAGGQAHSRLQGQLREPSLTETTGLRGRAEQGLLQIRGFSGGRGEKGLLKTRAPPSSSDCVRGLTNSSPGMCWFPGLRLRAYKNYCLNRRIRLLSHLHDPCTVFAGSDLILRSVVLCAPPSVSVFAWICDEGLITYANSPELNLQGNF